MYISEVLIFFLADCLSNQLIFSVAVHMFRVHVFDKAFFFSATVIMITENVTISSFHINHSKENKVFHHNRANCESKKKKWCQTERLLKKVVAKVYPLPLIRTQMLTVGLKCIRNYFLVFYYHLSYTCGEIICWTCLLFLSLNPLDSQFGHFVLRTSLKELY